LLIHEENQVNKQSASISLDQNH